MALHLRGVSASRQLTAFGAHTPWQAPLTHAWLVHVTGLPHCPLELHVCTPLLEHCFVPGTQTPMHVPAPEQADWTQGVELPQAPLVSHVSTLLTLHRLALGAQTPWQLPFTQA